jgi:predicted O-methyltransferase YrrM
MNLQKGPLLDARLDAVLGQMMEAAHRRPLDGGPRGQGSRDPADYGEFGFSIHRDQGELIYLLCRAIGATRVAEFATSIGVSTLYFAAAMRDNGGGHVIGSEIVPAKIATARRYLVAAGLDEWVDIRPGDARQTLRDLGAPIDFLLVDGWPGAAGPSLAREVIEVVAPQLRVGGIVMNDNGEADYLEFMRDPRNGFRSMSLPLKGGTELSVKVESSGCAKEAPNRARSTGLYSRWISNRRDTP